MAELFFPPITFLPARIKWFWDMSNDEVNFKLFEFLYNREVNFVLL